MSLFDVIRYPIDRCFRTDHLESLPPHILKEWWDWAAQHGHGTSPSNRARIPCEPSRIHSYLNNHTSTRDRILLLSKFKQIINEIGDEDDCL